MKRLVYLLGATAFCVSLAPSLLAQDCRSLPTSAGPLPVECVHAHEPSPLFNTERSGPMDRVFGYDALGDFLGSEYVRFTQNAPEDAVFVGPSVSNRFINAGDFKGDDTSTWYGVDFDGNAYEVDPTTGQEIPMGTISGPTQWSDLSYDRDSRQFYAIVSDCPGPTDLYTIDFDARTSTLIGSTTAATCGIGLAISPDGDGYLHDAITDSIYEVDLADGSAVLLGPTGFDANFAQSMDFDQSDGTLYLYAFNADEFDASRPPAELRTVNLITGATTFIGKITGAATSREITAGSSETFGGVIDPPVILDANPESQSVDAGEIASFTYQIACFFGGGGSFPGVVFYEVFSNGTRIVGPVQVASGTLQCDTIPTLAFSVSVPNATSPGEYRVDISAGPSLGDPDFTDAVTVTVTSSVAAGGESNDWLTFSADVWPAAEAPPRRPAVGAYPNPVAYSTTLSFELEQPTDVHLVVHDVLGRAVATLVNGELDTGQHAVEFDASDLPSGIYLVHMVAGGTSQTQRLMVVR